MPKLIIPAPSPKQLLFLRATKRHVGYGGARGGGKSWAIRAKAVILAYTYPGIKQLLVRKTYKELINNHVEPLKAMLHGLASYNKTDKVFAFRNGSTITLGYCASDGDLDQYQGAEYDVVYLDEATQLQEMWIKKIIACVRGVNHYPKRIYYTCNPGGVSHQYIKRLFVDRKYEAGENPDDYEFVQALVTDNKALMASDPDYIKQLEALPAKLRDAWLYGQWDIFDGQFFEEFADREEHYKDRRWTHVIDPFTPKKGWTYYRSFDWGYNKPFSCGWWAVDYDGVIYRILELYGCTNTPNEGVKWVPDKVFAKIAEIERDHPWLAGQEIIGVADPAIWDAETGVSYAETAAKHGVFFQRGDNRRIPGWMQCHYRLAFDDEGYPQMYVFSTCKSFIRTIPMLEYDAHNVEDIDTTQEDHIADEWRYFCMARPIKPTLQVERKTPMIDPLNMFTSD